MRARQEHVRITACCVALLVACGAQTDQSAAPAGEAERELIGGALDPGHPYVVALGDHVCTGTLISARTVLSAAHCVPATVIHFGADSAQPDTSIAVAQTVTHPAYDARTHRNDLALFLLAEDAPVAPAPLFRGTLKDTPEFIGPDLTWVGFGRTIWITDTGGKKQVAKFPIAGIGPAQVGGRVGRVDETMFYYSRRGLHTCNGDSGGPSFLVRNGVEEQAGVTSFGELYCRDVGVQARTDAPALAAFIQPTLDRFEQNNPCGADGACQPSCNHDGLVWDPDCHAEHCQADGLCATACVGPVDPDCATPNP